MKLADCKNAAVMLKIANSPKPFNATLIDSDASGIWVSGKDAADAIAQHRPVYLDPPAVFVPFASLEWLMRKA